VLALTHPPARIQPWRGPVRGFSFTRDVQPVLDKFFAKAFCFFPD
jgi:hypothetical protein